MNFYDLAIQWRCGDTIVEGNRDNGDERMLETALTFDHDYMFHVLFFEWDTNIRPTPLGFSLWFYGPEEDAVPVKRWDLSEDDDWSVPPYVDCSTLVQDWRMLIQAINK